MRLFVRSEITKSKPVKSGDKFYCDPPPTVSALWSHSYLSRNNFHQMFFYLLSFNFNCVASHLPFIIVNNNWKQRKDKKSLECVKVFCSIKLKFIASWTFHLKIAKLVWQQISSYTAFEKLLWLSHGYGYAQP